MGFMDDFEKKTAELSSQMASERDAQKRAAVDAAAGVQALIEGLEQMSRDAVAYLNSKSVRPTSIEQRWRQAGIIDSLRYRERSRTIDTGWPLDFINASYLRADGRLYCFSTFGYPVHIGSGKRVTPFSLVDFLKSRRAELEKGSVEILGLRLHAASWQLETPPVRDEGSTYRDLREWFSTAVAKLVVGQ